MGCWHGHGYHCGWPTPGWYGPAVDEADWLYEQDWPVRRRRYRREQPADPESTVKSLEARLDELRDELRRVEAALGEMHGPAGEAPGPR